MYFCVHLYKMRTTLLIQNLKCGGCAATIRKGLQQLDGIDEVQVDNDQSTVSFTYNKEVNYCAAKNKLTHLGYPLIDDDNSLLTKARSYVSCAVGRVKQGKES